MRAVIFDADNTLWKGEILNGKVILKDTSRETLKQIHKLGVKVFICSKNDKEALVKQLVEFDLMNYIDDVYANWEPKHIHVKEILQQYELNPFEVLFVDDDIVNRKEIGYLTDCHTDYEVDPILILKYFDTDRLIIQLQQQSRINAEKRWKGDFKDFIKQSNIECTIKKGTMESLKRITNLANRTNELNASRNRYAERDIKGFLKSDNHKVWVAYLKDKYGDYGLIAEVIVDISEEKEGVWFIQDLCVSCRTMGRGIGKKLLNYVLEKAKESTIPIVKGFVRPNKDNFRMVKLYESMGFTKHEEDDLIVYEKEVKF